VKERGREQAKKDYRTTFPPAAKGEEAEGGQIKGGANRVAERRKKDLAPCLLDGKEI